MFHFQPFLPNFVSIHLKSQTLVRRSLFYRINWFNDRARQPLNCGLLSPGSPEPSKCWGIQGIQALALKSQPQKLKQIRAACQVTVSQGQHPSVQQFASCYLLHTDFPHPWISLNTTTNTLRTNAAPCRQKIKIKIHTAFRKCTLPPNWKQGARNRNHYPLHWLWCKDQCTAQHLSDQFSLCWWWVTSSRVQMAIWVIKYLKRVKHTVNPLRHLITEATRIPPPLMEENALQWEFQTHRS